MQIKLKSHIGNTNIIGLYISLCSIVIGVFIWFFSREIEISPYLNIFGSLILLSVIGNLVFLKEYNFLSPFFICSLLIGTYSFNMFYISSYGIESTSWLTLLPISNQEIATYLKKYSFVILLYYYSFSIGVFLIKSKKLSNVLVEPNQWEKRSKILFQFFGLLLFTLGFIYFIYYSFAIANGPIDLLNNIGQISYLGNNSRAPILLCYIGVHLYTFYYLIENKTTLVSKFVFWFLSIVSFLVYLTSGRISLSIMHLLFIFIFLFIGKEKHLKMNFTKILATLIILVLSIGIYFARLFSSIYHSGTDQKVFFSKFEGVGDILAYFIIGKGNLLDMQQFVTMELYMQNHDYFYGETIFRAFFLTIYQTFNIPYFTPSLTMRDIYYPGYPGSPVSGAIVEIIMNFGVYLGAIFFAFLGWLFYKIYQACIRSNKLIYKVFYAAFFSRFLLGYLKVDASMISGFVWLFVPLIICYLSLQLFDRVYFSNRQQF